MTHEPECIWYDSPHSCDLCTAIRTAYQRGRDDASRAVGELQPFNTFWLAQHEAVDAAAGPFDHREGCDCHNGCGARCDLDDPHCVCSCLPTARRDGRANCTTEPSHSDDSRGNGEPA